ncbi:ISKra4 family transposase, partial [Corallococcus exiguus]|nr:ISKra4 family transposase [Corallococcus exiguus]
MPKVTLEVSEEVARLLKAMETKLRREAEAGRSFGEVDPVGALSAIDEAAETLQRDEKRRLLRGYDVDAPRLRLAGQLHARVGRYTAAYKTRQGAVEIERSLYREVGVRNGRTVDAISLRAGCVADGWLPEAAVPMGYLLARGTSREAQATARQMGVLPYCRASFERMGHEVGALY